MNHYEILIVEDEAIVALEMEMKITLEGYDVVKIVATGEEAVEIAAKTKPDLILMDIMLLGEMDGIEAAKQISKIGDIPIIYITGNSHLKSDERLLSTRPAEILSKPISDWKLFEVIEKVLVKRN